MVETIVPVSEKHWLSLRAQDLTSTEISSLFGCNPYASEFELYHRKAGNLSLEQDKDWITWGRRLQWTIASGVASDEGFKIRRMDEYIRDSERRLGASFDYEIIPDGHLEVKNVDGFQFQSEWIVEGKSVEAPPHIELQAQMQLYLSRKKFNNICALVGGNRVVMTRREPNEKIWKAIETKAAEFWDRVDSKRPPEPDFRTDSAFICALYSQSSPGAVIEADVEITALARAYSNYGNQEKAAKEFKDSVKAQLLTKIGVAEKVLGEGFTISAAQVAGGIVEAFERKPYRGFRVNWKRAKSG